MRPRKPLHHNIISRHKAHSRQSRPAMDAFLSGILARARSNRGVIGAVGTWSTVRHRADGEAVRELCEVYRDMPRNRIPPPLLRRTTGLVVNDDMTTCLVQTHICRWKSVTVPPSTTLIERAPTALRGSSPGRATHASPPVNCRSPPTATPTTSGGRDRNALRGAGAHSAYGSAWLLKKLTKLSGAQGG